MATVNRQSTILVADDDPANREILTVFLEDEGYRVVTAPDGDQALLFLEREDVDVVLLDVLMPGQTGFSVCRALRARPETRLLPVVLVTGLNGVQDRVLGIEAGADDFLNKPYDREELLARVRSLVKLKQYTDELEHAETVLCSLALSIEAKDPYTEGHCDRLSRYSVRLGERVGLEEEELVALRRGGIVHDIGKVAVPEHILGKPGPLNKEERKIMELHPVTGERICSPLKAFRLVLPIIRHHHERLDGSGYPDGLSNGQIPVIARILSIVDVYDALTTNRPYRQALSTEKAFSVIREEVQRGWWDASLVECFEESILQNGHSQQAAG